MFDLACKVFMVRVSYDQKPGRKTLMQLYGTDVIASPSTLTQSGRKVLAESPNHPGSLGIAISEAAETSLESANAKYALGSVLEHVLLHQTIIAVSYTHLRAHETPEHLVCRLLLEKKKKTKVGYPTRSHE